MQTAYIFQKIVPIKQMRSTFPHRFVNSCRPCNERHACRTDRIVRRLRHVTPMRACNQRTRLFCSFSCFLVSLTTIMQHCTTSYNANSVAGPSDDHQQPSFVSARSFRPHERTLVTNSSPLHQTTYQEIFVEKEVDNFATSEAQKGIIRKLFSLHSSSPNA